MVEWFSETIEYGRLLVPRATCISVMQDTLLQRIIGLWHLAGSYRVSYATLGWQAVSGTCSDLPDAVTRIFSS